MPMPAGYLGRRSLLHCSELGVCNLLQWKPAVARCIVKGRVCAFWVNSSASLPHAARRMKYVKPNPNGIPGC